MTEDREITVKSLREEIVALFNDENNSYEYSDRLQVALHETVDNFVSSESSQTIRDLIAQYDDSDVETLDKGMYEGILEKRGYDTFNRVLLYCLIEQDLYNDDDFNKLQQIEEVAGIHLK